MATMMLMIINFKCTKAIIKIYYIPVRVTVKVPRWVITNLSPSISAWGKASKPAMLRE